MEVLLIAARRFLRLSGFILLVMILSRLPLIAGDDPDTSITSVGRILLSGSIALQGGYDDNILDYSPGDIYSLQNHLTPARFSISREYDFITTVKGRVVVSDQLIENNPTSVRLRLNYSVYTANPIRNYLTWGVEIRQTFLQKNYLLASFLMLPEYYLRNLSYRDLSLLPRDWLKTVEARFERKLYSLEVGRVFSQKFSASVGYQYSTTTYNAELHERDNSTERAIVGASYRLLLPIRMHCDYAFSYSRAEGRMLSDSLTDISYRSHGLELGVSVSFRNIIGVPIILRTDFMYEYQQYLSDKVYAFDPFRNHHLPTFYGDKFHFGRIDRFYRITNELTYKIRNNLEIYVEYSWEENSSNLRYAGDTGNYQDHRVDIGIRFGF